MRDEGTSGAPRAVDVRDILSVIGLEAWSVNDGDVAMKSGIISASAKHMLPPMPKSRRTVHRQVGS